MKFNPAKWGYWLRQQVAEKRKFTREDWRDWFRWLAAESRHRAIRFHKYWRKQRGWTIPLTYAAVTLLIVLIFPRLEHSFLRSWVSTISAPAAMSACSAIASGMIALTGIVFSLTFVMVQFSASAYSPRLVLWVARDPVMSHALGVFTSTFLCALGMTMWIDRESAGKVPLLGMCMVVLLLLASMGMFIALIERISMLQINRMLIFTGDQGRKAIKELYSRLPAASALAAMSDWKELPVTQTVCHVGRPQVVQAIQMEALVAMARSVDAVIEVTVVVGDTLVEMSTLLRVYQGRRPLSEESLRSAFELGDERTFEQDPKYALRLVVDIAIKALSAAINDPTTAVQALDQVEDLLLRLGRCRLDAGIFHDRRGKLRLIVPFPAWEDFLRLALDEIRSYGADSVQVMRRMMALVKNLTAVLPAERHPTLKHWEVRLQSSIARSFADAEEKRDASVADRQGLGIGQEENERVA